MPGNNLTQVEAQERKAVVPSSVRYHVSLDLTTSAETFGSTTQIVFEATEGSSTFLDLTAESVHSIRLNGVALDPAEVFADHRIALQDLQQYNSVEVVAQCVYSHTGEGLHRSVDPSDGNVYLYSQFEVPDARRVFAVFDQPDIKAEFDFTVLAPESWIVTSNMPVFSNDPVNGQRTAQGVLSDKVEGVRRWRFETTPVMSSYLTAICAGPYAQWHSSYDNEDGRTVPMSMYCRQSLKDAFDRDVEYLFDITKKGFAFYAKIWGVPYPYAKYDQIYVPEYNAGAMENIGMVTFRDSYVFESKVSDAMKDRRVVTVLHELAHMWFGDYVTMKWWNDLWLNESFAEFMSTLCTAEATDWTDEWTTFIASEKTWGQGEDQQPTTHPIVAPIHDLNDTYINFDGITYAKGASVLKQLVAYVGREQFFQGIHNYLTKYAYDNATLQDLLQELSAASGRDLKSWSTLWLEQSGINTLSAQVDTDEQGVIRSMRIAQAAEGTCETLRPHRLAVGFYNLNSEGRLVRDQRFELDVDGEVTEVEAVAGLQRPDAIIINDDDLTYAKLRFDAETLNFVQEHLADFDDSLAQAIVWLSLWDMTRDAQYSAQDFIDAMLKALATMEHGTMLRYVLMQISIVAHQYVPADQREQTLTRVAQELWKLVVAAKPESDAQLQLLTSYVGYGADADFKQHVQSLLDGSFTLDGLSVDNAMRWTLIKALAGANEIDDEGIDRYLAERDTTENREYAYGAKAAIPTQEKKQWAFDQALHNDDLTNSQLEAVARGFSSNADEALYESFLEDYFAKIDWIWQNKSFHMAEELILSLYPKYADPAVLVKMGRAWLESHADADRACRNLLLKNVDASERVLKVRSYNEQLA